MYVPQVLLFIVFMLWSTSSYVVSRFVNSITPFFSAFVVVIVSFVVQVIFYIINSRKREEYRLSNYTKKNIFLLFPPAITGLCIYPILYFTGIGGTSPLQANVLNYLWPFFAVVTQSILFRKLPKKLEVCALTLALVGSFIITFASSSETKFAFHALPYLLFSFFGALSYGFYTGIIGASIPKTINENKNMPHSIRFFVMTAFSLCSFICMIFITSLVNLEWITVTLLQVKSNISKEVILYITCYALLNYTVAHYLWNRVNSEKTAIFTSTLALCIPFCSTVVLSFLSKESLDSSIVIGLTFILIGIATINWRYTSNAVSMAVLIAMIFAITIFAIPYITDKNIISQSHSFMQILIALYAIYYSFLVLRINSDYKELQKNIDILLVSRASKNPKHNSVLIEIDKFITDSPTEWASSKTSREKIINIIYKEREGYKPDDNIATAYLQILQLSQKSLTKSEWGIIFIITFSIIFLSFVMRDDVLISTIIAFVICCSTVFCDFTLYNEERKKKRTLQLMLKQNSIVK